VEKRTERKVGISLIKFLLPRNHGLNLTNFFLDIHGVYTEKAINSIVKIKYKNKKKRLRKKD